jgi:DNA-binding MarR family transcriptional regulator
VAPSKPLAFDPISEAHRQWVESGWASAADGLTVVLSIMRSQQIYLAKVNAALRRFDLTFARFELLAVLNFTGHEALPLNEVGARLQVHPASVTHAVDRLEATGLVQRTPHERDRRTTLVRILPAGRDIFDEAVEVLNREVFAEPGLSEASARDLVERITEIRQREGDFLL